MNVGGSKEEESTEFLFAKFRKKINFDGGRKQPVGVAQRNPLF